MTPQVGDKVRINGYNPVEGIVFATPESKGEGDTCYVGMANGATRYPRLDELTVLGKVHYERVNQLHLKPGDQVRWQGWNCLVLQVNPADKRRPYQLFNQTDGSIDWFREEGLELIHAAGHPEVKHDPYHTQVSFETPAPPATEPDEVMF